jgi:phosphoglycerate dehydrogenase-like enzyme
MTLNIHFNHISFEDSIEEFNTLLDPGINITEGDQLSDSANYEILVDPNPSMASIKASPQLRAVVIPWAGIPENIRRNLKNFPEISVHNLHYNNYNTAELGFGLLLAAAKHIIPMDQDLRKNNWTQRYQEPKAILLRDRTALILGFGEIGRALCEYCLGLGMKVIATKKHLDANKHGSQVKVYSNDCLHELLPKANVLLIALPLTDETENLIGETELKLLPKGSILINIGRGPIVNQCALYKALTNDHLRAAGSDVWYNYPDSVSARTNTPPADKPFGALDNFVLSPHRGALVEEGEKQRVQALADLLNAANRGEQIPNKVDLEAGY